MTRQSERYGDHIFSHAGDEERERLDALSEVLDPVSCATLATLPERKTLHCLELASGTGSVARWLADRVPAAQITATELDLRFLEAQGRSNLRCVRHDVTRDQFPERAFDLIHARWLLHHLPARDRVLAEITRWLAPEGTLVLEEPALFPLQAARDETYRRVSLGVLTVLAQRIGTDCNRPALDLLDQMTAQGLTDITMRVTCPTVAHDTAMGKFWRLTIEHLAEAIAALPDIDRDDVATVVDRLSRPGMTELGMATITVTATKPALGG